jgi:hypothetical protein
MKFLIPLIMVIELFYMILKGMKYLLIKKMFMGFPGKGNPCLNELFSGNPGASFTLQCSTNILRIGD